MKQDAAYQTAVKAGKRRMESLLATLYPSTEMPEELKGLAGLDIKDAARRLGRWYVLSNQQFVLRKGGMYKFSRAGYGELMLHTDTNNIVTKVSPSEHLRILLLSESEES